VKLNGATIVTVMGVLIVITGIALMGIQVQSAGDRLNDQNFRLISIQAGPLDFKLETAFPGVPLIAMGMMLLIVSAIFKS
jgi:hypothetical protein